MQQLLQRLLEEEVDGRLGRGRYERRAAVDPAAGYRNGFGKPRRLSLMSGTIMVRRPRVRGLDARFESRLLPLFKRRTEEVGRLLPELYLHGLAHGDFDLALRGLLGTGAPLSAASIARLKAGWQTEYEAWKRRRLDDLEPVYIWADGIYVKAGLEKDKAAMLVLIAALRDGRKVILAVGERRPHATARSLLNRGPCCAEPPEAYAETVPVGKRTAPQVQEKVAPRRAGIRPTWPFPLLGSECPTQKEVDECVTTWESIGRITRMRSGSLMSAGRRLPRAPCRIRRRASASGAASWTSGARRASSGGRRSSGRTVGWWTSCSTTAS